MDEMDPRRVYEFPKPLRPYYAKLLKAKTKEKVLEAIIALLREEENLSKLEKEKLLKMMLKRPMGRHRRKDN